jgi:hypothetical protein
MYDWEREALGVDTLGQIRGAIRTRMRVDLLNPSAQAWWIATLYGPDIWQTWRVGLLRGSIAAFVDQPVALPDPLVLRLPAYLATSMEGVNEVWDRVAVAPVVVEEKALAFAACGIHQRDRDLDTSAPRKRWELVAPTDLVARLRLTDGQHVAVRILPAALHRPDAPHQK